MKGTIPSFFLFLSDRLKEYWLIGLSDATFNEQRGRTVGGKLAWSSFCRTELMKPLWIKLKCAIYPCSCAVRIPHTSSTRSNICPNWGCKGSTVSPCKARLPLMRLSGTNETSAVSLHLQHRTIKFWKRSRGIWASSCVELWIRALDLFNTYYYA